MLSWERVRPARTGLHGTSNLGFRELSAVGMLALPELFEGKTYGSTLCKYLPV